ncbi:hypothetical protein GW17_00004061 [Ensete ventricosum]|nr:hypothetical protein GW17_00004061 [Ensete ventricosum]
MRLYISIIPRKKKEEFRSRISIATTACHGLLRWRGRKALCRGLMGHSDKFVVSVKVGLEMDPEEKTRPLSALGELKVNDGMVSSVLLSILQTAGDAVMVGVGGAWEGSFIGVETGNVNTKPSEVLSVPLEV